MGNYEQLVDFRIADFESLACRRQHSGRDLFTPIVDGYNVYAGEEERVDMQLVVEELGMVQSLVDAYQMKFCLAGHGGGEVYSALELFLRSKLMGILHDLGFRLESQSL